MRRQREIWSSVVEGDATDALGSMVLAHTFIRSLERLLK